MTNIGREHAPPPKVYFRGICQRLLRLAGGRRTINLPGIPIHSQRKSDATSTRTPSDGPVLELHGSAFRLLQESRAVTTVAFNEDCANNNLPAAEAGFPSMASSSFTAKLRETKAPWARSETTMVMSEPLDGAGVPLRTVKFKVTT